MVNFDIGMFLEFPGILVVVGVLLIVIAIVIGIFAVANDNKKETEEVEEDDYNVEVVKLVDENLDETPKEVIAEPVNLIKDNVIPVPVDDETVLEETEQDDLIKEDENDFLDTKEFVILDNEEKKDNTDVETL